MFEERTWTVQLTHATAAPSRFVCILHLSISMKAYSICPSDVLLLWGFVERAYNICFDAGISWREVIQTAFFFCIYHRKIIGNGISYNCSRVVRPTLMGSLRTCKLTAFSLAVGTYSATVDVPLWGAIASSRIRSFLLPVVNPNRDTVSRIAKARRPAPGERQDEL